jgi:DNA processing protein
MLKAVPGIGNLMFRRLLDRFPHPAAVLAATRSELEAVAGITRRQIAGIRRAAGAKAAGRELDRCRSMAVRVVTQNDPAYPQLLLQIPDPPPFLYVWGRLAPDQPALAVVGSRNATGYGRTVTRRICAELAESGVSIVSGLARGIDTAAHHGALEGRGHTLAVLGSGLARIYPAENRKLAEQIAERGGVVSEFPLDAGPDGHHFPARNRVISGISLGTLVVEATLRSGSLITARLAGEQNREVFAVPGSIQSFKSTGPHALIKQGAKLVENTADIVAELPELAGRTATGTAAMAVSQGLPDGLSAEERQVCRLMGAYPVQMDELIRQQDLDPGRLAGLLLGLELKGVVRRESGKRYVLTAGAEHS